MVAAAIETYHITALHGRPGIDEIIQLFLIGKKW